MEKFRKFFIKTNEIYSKPRSQLSSVLHRSFIKICFCMGNNIEMSTFEVCLEFNSWINYFTVFFYW